MHSFQLEVALVSGPYLYKTLCVSMSVSVCLSAYNLETSRVIVSKFSGRPGDGFRRKNVTRLGQMEGGEIVGRE